MEIRKLSILSKQNLTKGVFKEKWQRLKCLTCSKTGKQQCLMPIIWHRCRRPRRNSHQKTTTEHRQREARQHNTSGSSQGQNRHWDTAENHMVTKKTVKKWEENYRKDKGQRFEFQNKTKNTKTGHGNLEALCLLCIKTYQKVWILQQKRLTINHRHYHNTNALAKIFRVVLSLEWTSLTWQKRVPSEHQSTTLIVFLLCPSFLANPMLYSGWVQACRWRALHRSGLSAISDRPV